MGLDTKTHGWKNSHNPCTHVSLLTANVMYINRCAVSGFLLQKPHIRGSLSPTAKRVLKLQTNERLPIWTAIANIFNKLSRTAVKGWSCSLGVGRGANPSSE